MAPSLNPTGYWSAATVAAGQAFGFLGARTGLLVPDGVARVVLGGGAEPVRSNVALLPPDASGRVRWLNAAGRVIRSYTL